MKICQLCAVDFTLKNFLLPLIDAMQEKGWQVTAVCSDGPFVPELRSSGYQIQTVRIARSMNPLAVIRSLVALFRLFRRERFDMLHAHTPVAALIGRVAAHAAGIPLVVYTAHGFYFHKEMPRWKYQLFVALERFGGRFTHVLFSQSTEDAADAITERIVPSNRVLAIGNGVDVTRFDPSRIGSGDTAKEALGIPKSAYVIGFIGRQVREKGIVEFLQAAELLAVRHPHVWFLLIGERLTSDHAPGVDDELLLAKLALGQQLLTLGSRSDIPECLGAMDVFCLPSWREGMPRTIIEAMMMSKPVVATDIRGSREQVVAGETGLLVSTRSPGQLADALSILIDNPSAGKCMGAAGRRRALMLYDERNVVAMQLERVELEAKRLKIDC